LIGSKNVLLAIQKLDGFFAQKNILKTFVRLWFPLTFAAPISSFYPQTLISSGSVSLNRLTDN
jgi:hypothetical protein